jgi:hypothetical protein
MEEVGIQLSRDQVDPEPHKTDFYNSKNQVTGHLIYYVCRISDLSEIGLSDLTVPKSQLQIEEVDWAKFVGPHDAYPIINRSQMIILDRHLSLDK